MHIICTYYCCFTVQDSFPHLLIKSRTNCMTIHNKPGRPRQEKRWDLQLRHIISTDYLIDPTLHALMFSCGDHLTGIMQRALKEFIMRNKLPFQDPDFQQRLYHTASNLIAENRERPDATDVLKKMNELQLVETIRVLANSNATSPEKSPKPIAAHAATQMPIVASALEPHIDESIPVASAADPNPTNIPRRLPTVDMNLGPEIDENAVGAGTDLNVKKPSLNDRWLARHIDVPE